MTSPRSTRRSVAAALGVLTLATGLLLASACNRAPGSREAGPSAEAEGTAEGTGAARQVVRERRPLMGTFFSIQVVTDDEERGAEAIDAAMDEVARVEALISEWQPDSQISAVNDQAGRAPVRVGPEMLDLVRHAGEISELTDGAFDITFASCGHLWNFREPHVPSADEITACLPLVDYRQVAVDDAASTVFLPRAGMRIGVGGIGKGYGVDRAAQVLEARGITDYIVEGGGDIRVRGRNVGRPWTAGIAHPRRHGALLATLSLSDGAIVTSGDYESFFLQDGVLYHHILDPETGWPARGAIAVTVVAPDATTADALATGLFVMGAADGLALVERLPDVEALFVTPDREVHTSSGFPSYQSSE